MNPLGTRRAIEELARLLDGAVAGPGTPATATAGTAVAMLVCAARPSLAAATTARPEFRAALRTRLLAVAAVQAPAAAPAAAAWVRTPKVQRRMGVTAGAMAGVIALIGIGVAGSRSVPGEVFYGLKTGAEGLQLDLAHGDVGKGSKHLEFATTRLREVEALAHGADQLSLGAGAAPFQAGGQEAGGRTADLRDTLARMDSQTRIGSQLLTDAFRASGTPAPLHLLATWATTQRAGLKAVLPLVPPAAQASARSSLALVTAVGKDTGELLALGTCFTTCDPRTGGPALSGEPAPLPGMTAGPGSSGNGVPGCTCQGQPVPTSAPPGVGGQVPTGPAGSAGNGAPTGSTTQGPRPTGQSTRVGVPAPGSGSLTTPPGSLPTSSQPTAPPLPTLPVLPTLPGPLLNGDLPPIPKGGLSPVPVPLASLPALDPPIGSLLTPLGR